VNRAVSLALWAGTFTGVGLCLAAAIAHAAGLAFAPRLAWLGVLAFLLTPPLRLAVTAAAFWREGGRKLAVAAVRALTP
jgi:hypothetical protein